MKKRALTVIILLSLIFAAAPSVYAECDRVLVIDAGHGGADGGASTASGVLESGINLDISLKVQSIAGLFGTETVMTRESEDIAYPPEADSIRKKKSFDQNSRVKMINETENAVLLSIHQNIYPDSRPSGTQVLYASTECSKEFGELTHTNLVELLCPENRRVAAPISNKIYLMKSVSCPAILVECGFLSNPEEAEKLQTEEYQRELAVVLFASFMQYFSS